MIRMGDKMKYTQNSRQAIRLLALNRVAAIKLRQAGVPDDPATLPVVQLMTWGMATAVYAVESRTGRDILHLRMVDDQQVALQLLLNRLSLTAPALARLLLPLTPPAAAARLLVLFDAHSNGAGSVNRAGF